MVNQKQLFNNGIELDYFEASVSELGNEVIVYRELPPSDNPRATSLRRRKITMMAPAPGSIKDQMYRRQWSNYAVWREAQEGVGE